MAHHLVLILTALLLQLASPKEVFSPAALPNEQTQWNYFSPASLSEVVNRADFADIDNNLVASKAPLLSIRPISYTLSEIVEYQAGKLPQLMQTAPKQAHQKTVATSGKIATAQTASNAPNKKSEKVSVKEKREQAADIHNQLLTSSKVTEKGETKVERTVEDRSEVDEKFQRKVTKPEKTGREESLYQIEEDNRPLYPFHKDKPKMDHRTDREPQIQSEQPNQLNPKAIPQKKANEVSSQTLEIQLTNVRRKTPNLIDGNGDHKEKGEEEGEKKGEEEGEKEEEGSGNKLLLCAAVGLLSLLYFLSRRRWRKDGLSMHLRDEDLQSMM